jgi:tetratricopeptide (TPR) repeat protein
MADYSNTAKGNRYMETGEYRQAEIDFKEAVREHPDNAIARYYLGRFLLAQNKAAEALPHFQRTVALDPGNADYFFWLGVTYGELGDGNAEMKSYEQALRANGRHPQAHLYLGHLRLRNGEYKQAIKAYDAVLKEVPTNAAALYNRALILDIEGKDTEAKKAWLEYLKWYPAGQHALQATDHLNVLGDFSYENHFLGNRTVTLAEIKFQRSGSKVSLSAYPSLRLVGATTANLKKGTLQVVVYVNKNNKLAKQRAIEIENTLHELVPTIDSKRIRISWFDAPEKVVNGEKVFVKSESVRIFLTDWK